MKRISAQRSRMLGGIALMLLGLLAALYIGHGARERALARATNQVRAELVPVIEGDVRTASVQQRVADWVDASRAGVSYLTVRGPNRRLLASAGAWSARNGWLDRLISKSAARGWRALAYQLFCAERRETLIGANGTALGMLRLGVAWWWVLLGAGVWFWLAIVLALFGLGLVLRGRRVAAADPGSAPLADVRDAASLERSDPHLSPGSADQTTPLDASSSKSQSVPVTVAHELSVEPASAGSIAGPPSPASATLSAAKTHVPELAFGFLPVWRDAFNGLLAAGIVIPAYADEHGDSPWISIEELADSSSGEAERRALTTRLVQRLATLQANWQTLELPRVPLLFAVPSTLLDFDGAARAWAQALDGLDRMAEDLVLCVDRVPDAIRQALPVRWALADAEPDADGVLRYRLVADNAGPADSAASGLEAVALPASTDLAAAGTNAPMSAREFARLLSHRELVPL